MSDQHAYFADTVNKSRASSYFDFFARAPNGAAQHYFDWRNLENLNYANPEVQRLIVEAFLYWIREFDVDGFRVDVAWGTAQECAGILAALARGAQAHADDDIVAVLNYGVEPARIEVPKAAFRVGSGAPHPRLVEWT